MINIKMTIDEILTSYPEVLDYFVSHGFKNLDNEDMRKQLGVISLEMALSMKKINSALFIENLNTIIEQANQGDDSAGAVRKDENDMSISGLLPCPVRLPLLESFQAFEEKTGIKYDYDLKAASMGLDWLKEAIDGKDASAIDDVFISAGFDLFFDKKLIGKYKEEKVFKDFGQFEKYNEDFDNEEISLKDPQGDYSMLAVVPAVFLVNKDVLGDRKMPTSWNDILSPEFERSVSLPISDFDLFNAILLNVFKEYGEDGVRRLGKSLIQSMHPSQMLKSNRLKENVPTITIMPYFFTKMTGMGGPMVAVWPEDGAIISPIFMLTKRTLGEKVQPLVDFFTGKEVAKVLSHQGLFPSVNPEIDNRVPKENKYMWIGWDFIYQHDIGSLIKKCEQLFDEGKLS